MALFRGSKTTDARRRLTVAPAGWRAYLRRIPIGTTSIWVVFCGMAFLIAFSGRERLPYFLGQYIDHPVFSRVRFERVNQSRTADLRRQAQQDVPNYFRFNKALTENIQAELRDLLAAVNAAESFEKYQEAGQERWPLDFAAFDALNKLTDEDGSAVYNREIEKIIERLAEQEMVLRTDMPRQVRSTAGYAEMERGDGSVAQVPRERLTYAINAEHVERAAERAVGRGLPRAVRPVLVNVLRRQISPSPDQHQPIYVYDENLIKQKIDEAGQLPAVSDTYQAGDRLAAPGELDGETMALLTAEHEAYLAQRQQDPALRLPWMKETAGLAGLIALISAGLAVFASRCERRVAENPVRAIGLAVLLLVMLLANRLILVGMGASPIWSVATISMAATILIIAYSLFFAVGVTAILSLLTVLTLDTSFGLFVIHMTVAAVAGALLRDIRTRLKMVELGGITAIGAALCAILVGLMTQESLQFIIRQAAFAALAAMAGISIVLVFLPLIERTFKITTSLTLLEWADTSNPLLRRLIEKAPGTWQHSHLLGSMAEAAAEEIGANGLLVRVGAYYHDIGKMTKPQYFVENQSGRMSAHDRLAPSMSLLVILAHVKDGLAMAREHGLPRMLHQFIAEHHGTTIVRYFHAMAAQEARASGRDDREVSETGFRYPGPKPRTRESAILMLCDGVEGAVRSLAEPTPSRIESVVHEIFMARLHDGQFDDCEITLKDLNKVEQSVVKSLCAFHHGRIAYPKAAEPASSHRARTA